jgi:hypothetical protein
LQQYRGNNMDTAEATLLSFIVKLWLEDIGDETKQMGWHGYITHVPSGERQYLRELADILTFIKPYLKGDMADSSPNFSGSVTTAPVGPKKVSE